MLEKWKQYKKWVAIAVGVLLVVGAAIVTAVIITREAAAPQAVVEQQPVPVSPAQEVPAREMDRHIDFAALQADNPDIIAWMEVPGTVIDYPVCSTTDNVFYLTHDSDRQEYVGGAIFRDMSNPDDFLAPMMVVYGHFMPDESLFTQLHRYEDDGYFSENRVVKVFTREHQINYEVVAALVIDDRNILYGKDYTKPDDMQEFIAWIENTRDIGANIDLRDATADDRFLVLSTCTQLADSDDRYIVVARLESVI